MNLTRPVRLVMGASLATLALGNAFAATVPGEKWKQNITVQMEGMSMPMPGGEICAPVGKAAAAVAKPDKNCTVSNVKQSGNRFSADVKCTGKDAMEGTIDMTTGADKMSGQMRMRTAEGEMTMVMESQKLGSCQAVDTDALVADAQAKNKEVTAMAAKADAQVCASENYDVKQDPKKVQGVVIVFLQPGAKCSGKPLPPGFCGAVGSRGGFSSLETMESTTPGALNRSLGACKMGTGKASVNALRAKFLASAEADGDGDYLIAHAPARAKELAKSQCVIKGEMWAGRSAKWDTFCDSNFASEARE
jgi:hypothetical protein